MFRFRSTRIDYSKVNIFGKCRFGNRLNLTQKYILHRYSITRSLFMYRICFSFYRIRPLTKV